MRSTPMADFSSRRRATEHTQCLRRLRKPLRRVLPLNASGPVAWGNLRIKSRMALHTGTAELREGDYYGPVLNRAARLMSAGHGGQILLSLATEELARDHLPVGVVLRDLGERR